MSNTMKNILVLLGVVTLAYFGYYLQIQNSAEGLSLDTQGGTESAFARTQNFIQYQTELSAVRLDRAILANEYFVNRQGYSPQLETEPVGRSNPFLPTL